MAIPVTNNAAPAHTRGFFDVLFAGVGAVCASVAALAMLCCRSPANAGVARPIVKSATKPVRRTIMGVSFCPSGRVFELFVTI
jgi:hypothetical protein